MSALSIARRTSPRLRSVGVTAAAAFGLVALGLVCGKVATSHYEKLALEAAVGVPVLAAFGTLVYRRPLWGPIGIGAALVAIPSYAAPTSLHLVMHPMLIASIVVAVATILAAAASRRARPSAIDVCVALFFLTMLIAVLLGPRSWKTVTSQLWLWVLPYLAGRMIAGKAHLVRTLAKTLVFGLTALTPFALAEAAGLGNPFFNLGRGGPALVWGHPDLRPGESFRIETSFGHPIAYSMVLAVGIVLALVLLSRARDRRERLVYGAALAALLLDEALTLSRAGWVVIGVAILLLAAGRRHGTAGRAARRAILGGVAAVLALAIFIPSVAAIPLSLAGLQGDSGSTTLNQTAGYRAGLYSAAFNGHVGSLFGNATSKLAGSVQSTSNSVDSEYLVLLDQWGEVVAVSFLVIAGALAVRSLRTEEDELTTAFAVGAVGSMVALASVALITQQEYFVWLLIGLAAAPKPRPSPAVPADHGSPGHEAATPAGVAAGERTNFDVIRTALARRWWILVVLPLFAYAVGHELARVQPVKYTATSALLFDVPHFDQILYGVSFDSQSPDPNRQASTNLHLAELPVVATRAAADLGLSASRVASEVSVHNGPDGSVYTIDAVDRDPRLAARIANAYAQEYLVIRRQLDRGRIAAVMSLIRGELAALGPAQRRSVEGQTLRRRQDQLALISALQTGSAEIASNARTPITASSPNAKKASKYAGIIGLLIAVVLLFWIGRRDRRVRDAPSIEEAYGVPLIGNISDAAAGTLRAAATGRSAATADAFDLLRARLRYFHVDREIRSLMVVSASASEGRTTLALQLAVAEALAGTERVLLLEADLRRPSLAAAFELSPGPGLSDVVSRGATRRSAIRRVDVGRLEDGSSPGVMISVLPAGRIPPNPVELIESETMTWLLKSLADEYDLIVIDSPALGLVPDALPLLSFVSGVVIAARIGVTTLSGGRSIRDMLAQANASTLGVVVMSVPEESASREGLRGWIDAIRRRWSMA